MKLYTEEQVRIAYSKGKNDGSTGFMRDFEQLNLLPIELPSDEDIEMAAEEKFAYKGSIMGFEVGAKWMKEQILKTNNYGTTNRQWRRW